MNVFGNRLRVEIFGESHGLVVGVTLEGVPAGIPLCEEDFAADIDRRRPGFVSAALGDAGCSGSVSAVSGTAGLSMGATTRRESDIPHISGGLRDGMTTGEPLTIQFTNGDIDDKAYETFAAVPRPGHADFTAGIRRGFLDNPRGGGQFSGRMTVALVAAGVVAKKILATGASARQTKIFLGSREPVRGALGSGGLQKIFGLRAQAPVEISARLVELGGLTDKDKWKAALAQAAKEGDSLGGIVRCTANVPAGLGEPFWDSVESLISHAMFAIPGVRGIEFGDGFKASAMKGSEHNDPFGPDGLPAKNGSGGINGGITNGAPIEFRVAFKPTSSIRKKQKTLNFKTGEMVDLSIKGRHDVCFALRTPVIVEAMTAIVLADLAL